MALEYFDQFTEIGLIEQLHLHIRDGYDFLETLILDDNKVTFDYFYHRLHMNLEENLTNAHLIQQLFQPKNYLSFAQAHSKTELLPKLQAMFNRAKPKYDSTSKIVENKNHLKVASRALLIESKDFITQFKYFNMFTDQMIISFLLEDEKNDGHNLFERIILSDSTKMVQYLYGRFCYPKPMSLEKKTLLKALWKGKDYIDFAEKNTPSNLKLKNNLRLMQRPVYSRIFRKNESIVEMSDSVFIHQKFKLVKKEYDKYSASDFVLILLQRVSHDQTLFSRMIMKNSGPLIDYVFARLTDPNIEEEKQKELITNLLAKEDYVGLAIKKKNFTVLETVGDFYYAIEKNSPYLAQIESSLETTNVTKRKTPTEGATARFLRHHGIDAIKAQYRDLTLEEIVKNLTTQGTENNIFENIILSSPQLVQFFYDKFTENSDASKNVQFLKTLCENNDYIDFALTKERHAALPILIGIYELIGKTSTRLEEAKALLQRHSKKNDPIERQVPTKTKKQDFSLPKPAILHSFKTTKEKVDVGFNKPADNSANELFPELQHRDRLLDCFR